MKTGIKAGIFAAMLLMVSSAMRADTFRVFALENFIPDDTGQITGTITVNVTQGKAVYASIQLTDSWPGGVAAVSNQGVLVTDEPCGPSCELAGGNAGQTAFYLYADPGNPPADEPYLTLRLISPVSLVDWHGEVCWMGGWSCPGGDFTNGASYQYWTPAYVDDDGVSHPSYLYGDTITFSGSSYLEQVAEYQTGVTPEPSTFVLLGSGLFGAIGAAYTRRKSFFV